MKGEGDGQVEDRMLGADGVDRVHADGGDPAVVTEPPLRPDHPLLATETFSLGQTVEAEDRPWGSYALIATSRAAAVKILIVEPGQALSLQRHTYRAERWVAIDPGAVAEIGEDSEAMVPGKAYDVPPLVRHRLANPSSEPVRIVEVLFGMYDENDIERFADEYGRC